MEGDETDGGQARPADPPSAKEVSHNVRDQRLGLKGRKTRERIIATAQRLFESSRDVPFTLSAVARELTVGMTTLYLYFPDLGDLLLAVLAKVMDSADDSFVDRLRTRWPDESLDKCCLDFLFAHYKFWHRHMHVLLMRNSFADNGDQRLLHYRATVSLPLINLLVLQMDGDPEAGNTKCARFATVLFTGFERLATVVTTSMLCVSLEDYGIPEGTPYAEQLLETEAELLALTIRHQRDANKSRRK